MNLLDTNNKLLRLVIKHTKGMEVALKDVPKIVEAYFYTIRQFAKLLTSLAEIPLDEMTAKQFLVGFLYAHDQKMIDDETPQTEIDRLEISTRRMNEWIE